VKFALLKELKSQITEFQGTEGGLARKSHNLKVGRLAYISLASVEGFQRKLAISSSFLPNFVINLQYLFAGDAPAAISLRKPNFLTR
jgi:hypothetical protein